MIGIFDSGVGGLTVLRAVRERLPSCDVVYFGDTGRAPYGPRPRAELTAFTIEGFSFLQSRGAERLISACNSVSASLAISLYDALDLPATDLIEMVGPTVRALKEEKSRLFLCATEATIKSELYQNAFRMVGKEVTAFPIPELAGAIERGAPEEEIEKQIREATETLSLAAGDILVLACTHFPLAVEVFRRVLPKGVGLFDPAEAVAARAERLFFPRESGRAKTTFVISKDSSVFRALVARLFPETSYTIEVAVPPPMGSGTPLEVS